MELLKPTSLETSKDIQETLQWKISVLQEDEKNISNGLADYVSLSLDNLSGQLSQLKDVDIEIKARRKDITTQITLIKEEVAHFLTESGIDRLDGILSSSITLQKGKPAGTKKVFELLVPKKESEAFLVDAGLAVFVEKEVPVSPDTLRVNKRKLHATEVVEDDI